MNSKRKAVLGTAAAMLLLSGCGALPDVEQMVYDAEYELTWEAAESVWGETPRGERENVCLAWFLDPDGALDVGTFAHPANEDATADYLNEMCDWGGVR